MQEAKPQTRSLFWISRTLSMHEAIDSLVARYSDHPPNTSLVAGVLQNGRNTVYGYGVQGRAAPHGETLFEIGSVTKVFTTALLAILANEGLLALDQPIRDLAPELSGYHPGITLLQLATHTAALPKMPGDVFASMLRNPSNPYAHYSTDHLMGFLSRRTPVVKPITEQAVRYSNLGLALLGTLLARKLGISYEEAVHGRICEPLGLKDTCIRLAMDQKRRLAPPHNARGKRIRNWDMPAFDGAGALKSSASDLLAFLGGHLGQAPALLAAALKGCHEIRARTFPPAGLLRRLATRSHGQDPYLKQNQEGMGLGWYAGRLFRSGLRVHWHHGATGGYRAFAAFVPQKGSAVVILANSGLRMQDGLRGITATDRLGFEILDHLVENSG